MTNLFKIFFWIVIPTLFLNSLKEKQNGYKTISHKIVVNHPGEKDSIKTILNEIQDKNGLPIQYTMDVYSVICLEGVCKIIPVKLFWNNIGNYQKYELAEGETLEKYEADLFEPVDYIKLQSVLSDSDSPFKEVYLDEILTVPDVHGNEDVDAVSGATALELDEKDTVPGAALTCFTLWHWANGDVVSKIIQQTGKSASTEQLHDFILDDNNTYFNLAISELKNRSLYSKSIIEAVIKKAIKDQSVLRTTFNFLESATPEIYFYATENILNNGESAQKIAAIQSLKKTNYNISIEYLNKNSVILSALNSYQEVSLFLGLMEDKNPNSKIVITNTLPLLQRDFLIARRAYWFLKNKDLISEHQEKLNMFYKENVNRL
ncbi:hypothetical protein [uncultured Algibacter sp.]|uniref:hypothetical protein n=1 Tax=uncultured Algibacter sp. TaxID=298659 RepID=UPI00261A8FBD|nr:hypothetical protein [uncultured Algibacter sp.]